MSEKTNETKKIVIKKIKLKKTKTKENVEKNKDSNEKNEKNKKLLIQEYLEQLSDKEKQAYDIAKTHLKTSFNVERSIDFINWSNKK